jgi:hypothetical protein
MLLLPRMADEHAVVLSSGSLVGAGFGDGWWSGHTLLRKQSKVMRKHHVYVWVLFRNHTYQLCIDRMHVFFRFTTAAAAGAAAASSATDVSQHACLTPNRETCQVMRAMALSLTHDKRTAGACCQVQHRPQGWCTQGASYRGLCTVETAALVALVRVVADIMCAAAS